jgi:hypothetical protein
LDNYLPVYVCELLFIYPLGFEPQNLYLVVTHVKLIQVGGLLHLADLVLKLDEPLMEFMIHLVCLSSLDQASHEDSEVKQEVKNCVRQESYTTKVCERNFEEDDLDTDIQELERVSDEDDSQEGASSPYHTHVQLVQ